MFDDLISLTMLIVYLLLVFIFIVNLFLLYLDLTKFMDNYKNSSGRKMPIKLVEEDDN